LLCFLGPEFEGMTPGAVWADTTLDLAHWGDFGRMAAVTDVEWITNAVRLFAPLFHHPVCAFAPAEFDAARNWKLQSGV
jgi:hypothetical protein